MCDTIQIIKDLKDFSVFDGLDSKNEIDDHLLQSCGLVKPELVSFRKQQEIKNGKLTWVDVDFGYEVDFLKQLEKFLCNEDVLHCVDNPIQAPEGWFHSVLDGLYYRSYPVYLKDNKALAFKLYHDGLELCDTCSSHAGEHNITNFYWSLANIHPELGSTDENINLLASVKTSDLKNMGMTKFCKNLLMVLIDLQVMKV